MPTRSSGFVPVRRSFVLMIFAVGYLCGASYVRVQHSETLTAVLDLVSAAVFALVAVHWNERA